MSTRRSLPVQIAAYHNHIVLRLFVSRRPVPFQQRANGEKVSFAAPTIQRLPAERK